MTEPTRQAISASSGGVPGGAAWARPLGHWLGVEVDAHWTVSATWGGSATALATGTLPRAHPGDTATAYWLVAAATATAVVFFFTLLAHELAHALLVRGYGVEVKRITLWMLGGVTGPGGPSATARPYALVTGPGWPAR